MSKVAKYLNQHIVGNVYVNDAILERYSTDKSLLKIKPQMVVVPECTDDIRKVVRLASQLAEKGGKMGVTARGGGNDKTGAAIGSGIVLDIREKMNKILEIDVRQRLVRMQPGVTIGELNSALALYGMVVPVAPKYAGHTIGGMIANNLQGEIRNGDGGITNYVQQVEIVLSNGEVVQTERMSKRELHRRKGLQTLEGKIYRRLDSLVEDRKDVIDEFLAGEDIDNEGYEAVSLVKRSDRSFDILPLIFASQGTLGIVSEVILRVDFLSDVTSYLYAEFTSYDKARDMIDVAISLDPTSLNIYESEIVTCAEAGGKVFKSVKRPDGFRAKIALLVGFDGAGRKNGGRKVKKLLKSLPSEGVAYAVSDDSNGDDFVQLAGVVDSYLNDTSEGTRAPFIDSAYVPISFLGEYFGAVKALEKRLQIKMPVYGSVLAGVYSVRPGVDLKNLSDRQMIFKLMSAYAEVIGAVEGSLTGGAPEGRIKTVMTRRVLNERLADLYKHVKEAFDPHGVLNPGVKADLELKEVVGALRTDYDEGIIRE